MYRRALLRLVPLVLICLAAYGCGPGFPIQTAEQEAFVNNVEALNQRVARLEKGGTADAAQARDELDAATAAVAETSAGLQEMRQEFSFVKGSFEEAEFERAQAKEDIKFIGESLKGISERLDTLEASLSSAGERLAAIEASIGTGSEAEGGLGMTIEALTERVSALEETGAAPAQVEAKKSKPEDLYAMGLKHIKEKEYREGTEAFTRFLTEFPKHKLADHAQYWLGEIYYAKGDWERAIIEFDKVIKTYPDGDKVPAATLKQGYSFEKLGSDKEARLLLEQVIKKYPKSNEAAIAKKRLKGLESE